MEKHALTPAEAIQAVIANGRRILTQPLGRTFVLALLAGFYIAFGAQLTTVVTQDAAQWTGQGLARLLGGGVFSVGLMLVVVCGAELFTGNSLLAAAALHGAISWNKLLENWAVVLLGNFVGALLMAWLLYESNLWEMGAVAEQAVRIAASKCKLSFEVAFVRGLLCNWLVCLAVVMATAARDITGKFLACFFPIMAFVTSGFEHSIANIYFIPEGILVARARGLVEPALNWDTFLWGNLLPVTLGNIVGGVVFVATAYWYVHAMGNNADGNKRA
ncbi:formate/nitrite transporter family protein [Geobacter sp. SVR]|uniref:formate/nitrite transporter family protein n=1 Tax=Geobacter sp. SVR TaxID=2495594 RepID=UPI00143EFD00|nr:formate/nitrite transporter family protein [Geobacter sp. SVR]BCS52255.1 bidirectional formate transporter [Geobacter sp. SVR]GCF85084.1 bidirectional formate transporter [Geobacter sp. SVR]